MTRWEFLPGKKPQKSKYKSRQPRDPKGELIRDKNGRSFDSKGELKRYQELLLMEKAGLCSYLERQKRVILQEKFTFDGKTVRSINYYPDFVYFLTDGTEIWEDFKGFRTPVFALKERMIYKHIKDLNENEGRKIRFLITKGRK